MRRQQLDRNRVPRCGERPQKEIGRESHVHTDVAAVVDRFALDAEALVDDADALAQRKRADVGGEICERTLVEIRVPLTRETVGFDSSQQTARSIPVVFEAQTQIRHHR